MEKIAHKVIDLNGQCISADGKKFPVSVRAGALRLGKDKHRIGYSELFDRMQKVIYKTCDEGKIIYFDEN